MRIIATLWLLLLAVPAYTQSISPTDFRSLIPFLQQEDFKGAFEHSERLLAAPRDTSSLRAMVVYMHIYAGAGMVAKGQLSHKELLKKTKPFVGQRIVMPAHPCVEESKQAFNSLQLAVEDGRTKGTTITSNAAKTTILAFEYFQYQTPPEPVNLLGKMVRNGGILTSIEVNPNNSTIWIARLHVGKAFARVVSPQ